MAAIQNVSVSFVAEVMIVQGGRKLGLIVPDADGYYQMPLGVLGVPTRNRTYYDVTDFVEQVSGKESFVRKMIEGGQLFGEYGHPDTSLLNNDQTIARLLHIEEKLQSHHFKKIWSGEKLAEGGTLIYGLVKPTGPYGQYLRDSLNEPLINTAFSLRGITSSIQKNGLIWRNLKRLVTFDFVGAGGYEQASKRFSPCVERVISFPDGEVLTDVALERLSNHELNDIFGTKKITLLQKTMTYLPNRRSAITEDGELVSVLHELMKGS